MALTLIGGAIGAPIGVASQVAGQIRQTGEEIASVATRFDTNIIIRYGLTIIAITAILIFFIQFARGLFISVDMFGCGIGNTGCDLPFVGGECSDCSPQNMQSWNWMWDVEWYLLCFFYLGIAMVMGCILYIWLKKLLNLLLNVDYYLDLLQRWIYGEKKLFSDELITR